MTSLISGCRREGAERERRKPRQIEATMRFDPKNIDRVTFEPNLMVGTSPNNFARFTQYQSPTDDFSVETTVGSW
jgi:hypothetical protein